MSDKAGETKGTRVIALVGPAGAGKTSLAEAMLFAAGATDRLGSTANGSSIGDFSPEARARGGSTELNLYNFDYLGDHFAILDCPGSVGFAADGARALAIADVAIVVVDPDPARAAARRPGAARARRARHPAPHLRQPHRPGAWPHPRPAVRAPADERVAADRPPDPDPGWRQDHRLRRPRARTRVQISRRARKASGSTSRPTCQDREVKARTQMLEQLADHDDELLEQLLMDQVPGARESLPGPRARNRREPWRFGAVRLGRSSWGVRRLLKALRHEVPGPAAAANRLGVDRARRCTCSRSSTARSAGWRWRGCSAARSPKAPTSRAADGDHARLGALFQVQGEKTQKVAEARDGDVVAVAKVDHVKAGEWLGTGGCRRRSRSAYPARNCAMAIEPADRKDDVKLSGALQRLPEEDCGADRRA